MDQNKMAIVDTDIHERVQYSNIADRLDEPFRHYIKNCHWVQEKHMPYTQPTVAGVDRADAVLSDGRPAGTDLGFMQKQLLDEIGHDIGILTGDLDPSPSSMHGWYEMATALASAPLDKGIMYGATTASSKPGDYDYCHHGEIIRCPWHGREFDIKNDGRMLANPDKRIPSFNIRIEDENVIVRIW
ncbi:hypothetical protein ABRT01_14680 [Lentibacillus sp. L22]|uniref:Rieske (2Fe-2S) protein n=1 Tax=Lentibacillus sp. L22 TaxID=3163028 RepID=UPI0034675856